MSGHPELKYSSTNSSKFRDFLDIGAILLLYYFLNLSIPSSFMVHLQPRWKLGPDYYMRSGASFRQSKLVIPR